MKQRVRGVCSQNTTLMHAYTLKFSTHSALSSLVQDSLPRAQCHSQRVGLPNSVDVIKIISHTVLSNLSPWWFEILLLWQTTLTIIPSLKEVNNISVSQNDKYNRNECFTVHSTDLLAILSAESSKELTHSLSFSLSVSLTLLPSIPPPPSFPLSLSLFYPMFLLFFPQVSPSHCSHSFL